MKRNPIYRKHALICIKKFAVCDFAMLMTRCTIEVTRRDYSVPQDVFATEENKH